MDIAQRANVIGIASAAVALTCVTILAFAPVPVAIRILVYAIALVCGIAIAYAVRERLNENSVRSNRFDPILERMVADLAKTTVRVSDAKRATESMIESAASGMLALDRSLAIGPTYSREVETLLRTKSIAGRPLLEVLRPLVVGRSVDIVAAMLRKLYDDSVADADLAAANVLDEIEVVQSTGGEVESRFISFRFERVRVAGAIADVFVFIDDVTDRVRMTNDLAQARQRRDRQHAMLQLTLNTPEDRFAAFATRARSNLKLMATILRPEDYALVLRGLTDELRDRFTRLVRATRDLRLACEDVSYAYFADLASGLERRALDAQALRDIDGDTFLSIVALQGDLRKEFDDTLAFRAELGAIRPLAAPPERI
ncbi:MAG: hypothetical protein NVS4B5_18010 [Vulcanimicrobiaceae bacterium]